jgi:hypothetical protein
MKKLMYGMVMASLLLSSCHLYYWYVAWSGESRSFLEINASRLFPFLSWGSTALLIATLSLTSLFFLYWQILQKKNAAWYNITALILLHVYCVAALWPFL